MSLIKWNPERSMFPTLPFWMDDFFADDNGTWPSIKGVSIPAVNIAEGKDAFKLDLAAPGFKKDDFKIEVKNGYLVITGETKTEKEDKDDQYTRREFRYNTFSRSFALPENVNAENINAQYSEGILKMTLPKSKAQEKAVKPIVIN
jgi:HSP20 family protein